MSEGTKIQWADDTANFWRGCTKVSPGCAHCYAEKNIGVKLHGIKWGNGAARVKSVSAFDQVRRWNRKPFICLKCGTAESLGNKEPHIDPATKDYCGRDADSIVQTLRRRRVFSLSLGDWLDEEVPIEWLAEMLQAIHDFHNLDFLLLTKRPEKWSERLHQAMRAIHNETDEWISEWLDGLPPMNVWLGVSVENQEMADLRIPELIKIPAAVRFLSCEPLLGEVNLCVGFDGPQAFPLGRGIDWVIVGGESGPKARPCNIDWIRSIVEQCKAANVACFVKQFGANPIIAPPAKDKYNAFFTMDKKGGDISEWPEDLRVREFPTYERKA